jgi:hypothetical protein
MTEGSSDPNPQTGAHKPSPGRGKLREAAVAIIAVLPAFVGILYLQSHPPGPASNQYIAASQSIDTAPAEQVLPRRDATDVIAELYARASSTLIVILVSCSCACLILGILRVPSTLRFAVLEACIASAIVLAISNALVAFINVAILTIPFGLLIGLGKLIRGSLETGDATGK